MRVKRNFQQKLHRQVISKPLVAGMHETTFQRYVKWMKSFIYRFAKLKILLQLFTFNVWCSHYARSSCEWQKLWYDCESSWNKHQSSRRSRNREESAECFPQQIQEHLLSRRRWEDGEKSLFRQERNFSNSTCTI